MARITEPKSSPKSKGTYGTPLTAKMSEIRSRTRIDFSTSDRATKRVIAPYVKIVRKGQMAAAVTTKVEDNKLFNFYLQRKPSILMRDLSAFLSDSVDLPSVLNETSDVLKSVTRSLGVSLYLVDEANQEIHQNPKNVQDPRHKVNWKIGDGRTVASFVAQHKEYVMVDDILGDERFPDGVGHQDQLIKSVLCVPVVTPSLECLAVIELYRDVTQGPFQKDDLRIVIAVTGWMGAALHQNQQRLALEKQQQLNDYLLDLIKCYFADTMLKDKMISEFVKFAKVTLSAEKGSFFIIDKDSEDLAADLYEEGIDASAPTTMLKKNLKVKLAKETNIAALVAQTREVVNIKDAYNHPRFNKEVDCRTRMITRSVLCMPVLGVDELLGVVQVVNKKNGPCFTEEDENLFKTFSVYCALALHYSRLETEMKHTDRINQCNLKLMQYHVKPCIHDIKALMKGVEIPEKFETFDWYVNEEEKQFMPHYSLYMLVNTIGEENVVMNKLMEFVLSVKKCYRNNPYHNFEHAFNVCHCMYNIILRNKDKFTLLEQNSLVVAALCHDIDHGGFTNNFLTLVSDNLVQLYEESPLENHHYHVTMSILSDCNMFRDMSDEMFKEMMAQIRSVIIATDLANYFRGRTRLLQICHDDSFAWEDNTHRNFLKAIMITGCDLSGQCKPYPVAKKITENLYREFYNQGDIEKQMGIAPLSMMDREKQHMIPADQVQFLSVVVQPCTELLFLLLPNTEPLYNECCNLRDTWNDVIGLRDQKCWQQEQSVVKN